MMPFILWRRSNVDHRAFYRADPRPIPAGGTRRRLVVTISALMVASFVLTALVHEIFAMLTVVVVGPAGLLFALWATRNMTFIDPAYLDERERAQTLEAYRVAFLIIAITFLVLGGGLSSLNAFVLHISQVDFTRVTWLVILAGLYLIPWTPVAVLAWRLPDEPPEDEPALDTGGGVGLGQVS